MSHRQRRRGTGATMGEGASKQSPSTSQSEYAVIIYGVIPAPIRKGNFAGEEHGADVSSDHQKPRLILNAFSLCLCAT